TKTGLALCHPGLIGAALIIGFLLAFKVPNETYQAGTARFSWLMTPCTVCFAIPLYKQLERLRGHLGAVLLSVAAGSVSSLLLIGGMCLLFSLSDPVRMALLPKSITTAMAIPLSESADGLVPLTTAAVILTGILGSVTGPALCRVFAIRHPIARGVAYGTASHIIGTTKAAEENELSGAVGSLSLVAAGILTAVLFPIAMRLF
ncbi:MAG: LrgB family protein, partial [Clostridia bacterium]|nr:LrgB family protein [Clostridia bacterium]